MGRSTPLELEARDDYGDTPAIAQTSIKVENRTRREPGDNSV